MIESRSKLTISMIRWPQIAHFSAVCWNPEYYGHNDIDELNRVRITKLFEKESDRNRSVIIGISILLSRKNEIIPTGNLYE